MGQIQSDSYQCESENGAMDSPRDSRAANNGSSSERASFERRGDNKAGSGGVAGAGSGNRQIRPKTRGSAGARSKKNLASSDRVTLEQQQQQHQRHVRKLSNVSNRNIQLLSMKPRSEKDSYADGLRTRRRSSLINLILGAPSRGPRFSEDLCSLSSHMSELCNFGIDYFPDTIQSVGNNSGRPGLSSIGSSLSRLEDGPLVNLRPTIPARATTTSGGAALPQFAPFDSTQTSAAQGGGGSVRRRSSLGSLASFDAAASVARVDRSYFSKHTDTNRQSPSCELETAAACTQDSGGECQAQQEVDASRDELPNDGRPVSPSITSPGCHQLGAHQGGEQSGELQRRHQWQQHQRRGSVAPNLSPVFLASVDLTSSLDGCDGCPDDFKRQATGDGIPPGEPPSDDNPSDTKHVSPARGYCFNVRAALKIKKKTPGPLIESVRNRGCSQNSGSSLLLSSESSSSSSATNLRTTTTIANRTTATTTTTDDNDADRPVDDGEDALATADAAAAATARSAEQGVRHADEKAMVFAARGRINHAARRMIHRSGSELSLYSSTSHGSITHGHQAHYYNHVYPRHISRGSIGSVMLEAGAKRDSAASSVSNKQHPTLNGQQRDFRAASIGSTTLGAEAARSGAHLRETKLIIMLQVCLPFILAGFGNMGAGLVLNQIAHWDAFRQVPIFFVLLPSFVGLKGNMEMTLASRLSTLSNLNLLDTSYQRRHAFLTNLILILSQAIGLSIFASIASVACELSMGKLADTNVFNILNITILIVLPAALVTSIALVIISSIVMWFAIWLANRLQVNPDNLSTLLAALYGDVSCVLTYGLFAQSMYSLNQQGVILWPLGIIGLALISWPLLWYVAYRSRETHELALSSMPPMLAAIMVSLGSGAVLSLVVDKFARIALYQPVVNGFGANLIAVQASRVSTWLWCSALRKISATGQNPTPMPLTSDEQSRPAKDGIGFGFEFEPNNKTPYGSLASFVELPGSRKASVMHGTRIGEHIRNGDAIALTSRLMTKVNELPRLLIRMLKILLWSFCNSTPNAVAARLLLMMLIPAHSLYFLVIWLVAPNHYVVLTWPFYVAYILLCVVQVFLLLAICQPLMTFLMRKHLDPDIFGISLLMALADLIGTLCLTGAFYLLNSMGDPNAS